MKRSKQVLYLEDVAFKIVLRILKCAVWWMKKLDAFKSKKII